jgi:ketosteroid isomerase-like protein
MTPSPEVEIDPIAYVAVMNLLGQQAQAIDRGDADGWAATFRADGSFRSPTFDLLATGTAELRQFAEMSFGRAEQRGETLRHQLSSLVLTATSADLVDVRGYLTILALGADGIRIDRCLRVHDRMKRDGQGRWLTQHREVIAHD